MPTKKVNKKKIPQSIFSKGFNSIIFLSALSLNFLLLGLFMHARVRQRDTRAVLQKKQSSCKKSSTTFIAEESNVLGETFDTKDLPGGFPSDFPLYYGSILTDAWEQESKNLDAASVVWETDDLPRKVFDYYVSSLVSLGWESEIVLESEGSYTLSFKKEGVEGFVGVSAGGLGKTVISATVGVER